MYLIFHPVLQTRIVSHCILHKISDPMRGQRTLNSNPISNYHNFPLWWRHRAQNGPPKKYLIFSFICKTRTVSHCILLKISDPMRGQRTLNSNPIPRYRLLKFGSKSMTSFQTLIKFCTICEFWKFCCNLIALAPRVPKNPKTSKILKGKGVKFGSEH